MIFKFLKKKIGKTIKSINNMLKNKNVNKIKDFVEELINIRSLFFELLLYSSVSIDILSYLCEYLSQFPFSLSET